MCKSCSKSDQSEYMSELAIHFPGRKGLTKPLVFLFPKLKVCLECGLAEFAIPESELRALKEGAIKAA